MKKLIVLMLAALMVFTLAACGGEGDESSAGQASSKTTSTSSKTESSSTEESDESSTPDESSKSDGEEISYLSYFVSNQEAILPSMKATDGTSIRFTKFNSNTIEAGDSILFTPDYGSTITAGAETYEGYTIIVCEYDIDKGGYYMKKTINAADADETAKDTEIPEQGFVMAISEDSESFANIANLNMDHSFFPHGAYFGDKYDITKATTAPTIDGAISESEYGAPVFKANKENDYTYYYSKFDLDNIYATADIYMTYDDEYLYFGVVVASPYHYAPVSAGSEGGMYEFESIQVNVSTEAPTSEYIIKEYDHAGGSKAVADNVVRQFGFCVSSTDDKAYGVTWMGATVIDDTKYAVVRDAENQFTYYEVAIPWTDANDFDITSAEKIGFSVSINSTTEEDYTGSPKVWRNIIPRDTGGIIGRNDFSKLFEINLK